MNAYTAEFIGTMMLVLFGNGVVANVVLARTKGFNAGWIVITAGWGIAVFIGAFCSKEFSGAHINPAVTLAMVLSDNLDVAKGGQAVGIDAAAKMIQVARKKRGNDTCRFDVVAAESLPYEDASFDAVVSSLFFHHVDLELKQRTLAASFRVLKPGGKLVIADMHIPTTWMGWLVSWTSRWFFMQPQIAENIRGMLPRVMTEAGFSPPAIRANYFGYIAIFTCEKPGGGHGTA